MACETISSRAHADRDLLLATARRTVVAIRDLGVGPDAMVGLLHTVLRGSGLPVSAIDDRFVPVPGTGLEALAFVVTDPERWGTSAAGAILRHPGRMPHRYEPVDLARALRFDTTSTRSQLARTCPGASVPAGADRAEEPDPSGAQRPMASINPARPVTPSFR